MEKEYKIIIVDDHKIFREGLTFVISQMKGFNVIGEASNGCTFLEILDTQDVDIVLMDISMPEMNGIEATIKAINKYPDLKVIALSMFSDSAYYNQMIQAGVSGFILKESGKEELVKALNTVVNGEKYFSPKLLHNIILNANIPVGSSDYVTNQENKLDQVEIEILRLICQGLSNAEIARKLSRSFKTIEAYKTALLNKTGVKNAIGLAVFALKNHLIDK